MEIRHLITFKTIIDLGGFTKAAEHLGYAQSTITSHIKALEDELGQPVFNRIGKKVLLTETGNQLLPHALKMLSIYKYIKEISSENGEIQGEIVISAPEVLLIYRLPPVIKAFKETCPKADIQLKHLEPTALYSDLANGNADLAFIVGSNDEFEEALIYEKLNTEPMAAVSPNLSIMNNFNHQVLLYSEKGCCYRQMLDQWILENEMKSEQKIELWSIEAIKQCIICGLGVSVLPYIAIKNELEQGKLTAEKIGGDRMLSTYMAFHKDKWLSPALKVFIDIVKRQSEKWKADVQSIIN
ncbi:DNA-binding transcriptional LysR family regulator [Scopulibacillus daqui]|uniref:DNA-binding transcriptional LysR family regulator n=1 Tax=Scopulibacillus daqui TaxID=1469162 RepID=A0ABS2Q3S6_9BACL|nr:LysR family transcriptional regulator [Scopulibacillus daqui]MBM7646776.1 DNA-binding transcriptional LysR family regulator [Scopulibacillus daqui]